MTRAIPAIRLASAAAVLLACAACGGDTRPVADEVADPSPSTSPVDSTSSASPPPAGPETPATTAGPLSQSSFPRPQALGPGWEYAVDPGGAEEGYVGNGTPALERDPGEVVLTAVPLGCARRAPLPTPEHVLEVDYRFRGTSVIALRMRFADEQAARSFHEHRRDNLEACRGRSGGQAVGVLVRTVRGVEHDALLSDRTPDSDPWTELAVLHGDDVVLVASRSRPEQRPLTRHDAPSLAARFRT